MVFKQVSFPGFGIGPFELDPDAISIGDFSIKWYALFIVTGILFAVYYVYLQTRKKGFLLDDILDCALWIVFPAIICARLYYVIFKKMEHPDMYTTFLSWFDIRSGGLAIYGGIIGGAVMTIIMMRIKKIRFPVIADAIGPGLMVAQAIGRWGNFMNVEAYGEPTSNIFRMGILMGGEWEYVHPTFLYESLWNLTGFALILLFYYKLRFHRFDGQVILSYFIWYGLGRMWIEGLRTDSLYIGQTGIRVSQLVAFLCFVWGVVAYVFFYLHAKAKKSTLATCVYYENAKHYEDGLKAIEQYEAKKEKKRVQREEKKRQRKDTPDSEV